MPHRTQSTGRRPGLQGVSQDSCLPSRPSEAALPVPWGGSASHQCCRTDRKGARLQTVVSTVAVTLPPSRERHLRPLRRAGRSLPSHCRAWHNEGTPSPARQATPAPRGFKKPTPDRLPLEPQKQVQRHGPPTASRVPGGGAVPKAIGAPTGAARAGGGHSGDALQRSGQIARLADPDPAVSLCRPGGLVGEPRGLSGCPHRTPRGQGSAAWHPGPLTGGHSHRRQL